MFWRAIFNLGNREDWICHIAPKAVGIGASDQNTGATWEVGELFKLD